MKTKKILIILVIVVICSSFATAGLSDMLTGHFNLAKIFALNKVNVNQANQASPQIGPEEEPLSSAAGSNEVLLVDEIRAKNGDIVTVSNKLEVNSADMNNPAIKGHTTGGPIAVKGEADNGIYGEVGSNTHSAGVYGYGLSWANGVTGENANGNAGMLGEATAGVRGYTNNPGENAVFGEFGGGENYGTLGSSVYGVYGYSYSKQGIMGESNSGDGVYGKSTNGYGVYGTSINGLYGIGTNQKVYAGNGIDVGSGASCTSRGSCNLDIAEDIPAAENVEAGDVVVIDQKNTERVVKSTKAYDTNVAGVISTNPAFHIDMEDSDTPLALAGRVPAKVSTENGAIQIGDLLTTSNTPGYAMRCKDRFECSGVLVGKALEPLASGKGKIIVLVTLG